MRISILSVLLFNLLYGNNSFSQVFFQESFETSSGWNLSHTFDDGNNKFVKRDLASNFPGLEFVLFGQDGEYVMGAENTDANVIGSSDSGIIILTLDETDITGRNNLECVVSVACNPNDQSYDDRSFTLGDYLDFDVSIDNGTWTSIGSFNSSEGSDQNSPLYHDANGNGDGGEIGEAEINGSMLDYVLPITGTGDLIQIRARFKMDESAEEIVFDNIRLRENTADDTAPTINSVELIDDQTIRVFFNESVADNSDITSFYTGISNLNSVSLINDNFEAILNYSVPFEIGVEYNLVIFGLTDMSSNAMTGPYFKSFYYNPTTPNLVITEIMYNDPNTADTLEYIEVYNNDEEVIQLGGFVILGAVDFTFPTFELAVGDYFLIARRPSSATAFYGISFENYSGSLPNSSGNIIIRNTNSSLIDQVSYESDLPWPLAGDGVGSSIELADVNSDNNLGNNWTGATNGIGFNVDDAIYGTPGFANSTTLPVIDFVDAEYNINEIDGSVEISMNISVSNNTASSVDLSFDATSTGTSSDVDLSGYETISFSPSFNGVLNFTLPVIDDGDLEGYEYIIINMNNFINAAPGTNSSTVLLINDDEYSAPPLFINELQSANASDIMDENGEFDDWFEIYNPNDFAVDLAGYYVTDDFLNLTKHRIKYDSESTIIEPLSWLLFWADENGNQGPLHTNFKLSSSGEVISLQAPDGTSIIDQKGFPAIPVDQSYGRQSDGSSTWITFSNTTPNASNLPDGLNSIIEEKLFIYPNPTQGLINWHKEFDVELRNIQGQIVLNALSSKTIDLSKLNNGIYILSSITNDFVPVKIILNR